MKKLVFFLLVLFLGYKIIAYFLPAKNAFLDFSGQEKIITIDDNELFFETQTGAETISQLLEEKQIPLADYDQIIPKKHSPLLPGANIRIRRAVRVAIEADGQKKELHTLSRDVAGALLDGGIVLGEDDLIKPALTLPLKNNLTIAITRVDILEEIVEKPVDFATTTKEDDKLGWRIKKVQQKGAKGVKEIRYKVVSHDGQEISRKILDQKITKEPQPEIVVQGTFVKIGKSHTGLGTWYAWKGGLFAASPWLPMGSFAKVTNKENGKSVIVQINDRGPFGSGRIIDLDKVAFAQIASIGAGVIDVKVEEILN